MQRLGSNFNSVDFSWNFVTFIFLEGREGGGGSFLSIPFYTDQFFFFFFYCDLGLYVFWLIQNGRSKMVDEPVPSL